MNKPAWWDWPFDCENVHVRDRMVSRQFSETDLRDMLEQATRVQRGEISSRFSIYSRYNDAYWKIVVEPDESAEIVVVVTAFTVEELP